ncbi:phosphatidylinositol-specific phospholipase C domain-containing protein [Donghicola mangrovi]|uniref:1-phosphatidylinositol phosphodiesterase n=1 Tax=Donghicola mangrovi TaxID=2729614 RepID=A0A850QFP6_9RHOB|nr:phosphatidylinositol-specific phospholipase C domain-containing protein [Donghicola mangrovi]NVO24681.1 hypothetical protein [Donghicola mangrovi]
MLGNAAWIAANAAAFLAVLAASTVMAPVAGLGFARVRKIFQAQTLNIREQLDFGVRFLDLRINRSSSGFVMHHGPMPLFTELSEVLSDVAGFLADNPSETVMVCFKRENTDDALDVLRDLLAYLKPFEPMMFAQGRIPDLGEVRGRIVFVNRITLGASIPGAEDKCGIYLNFADNQTFTAEIEQNGARSLDVVVQDHYQPPADAISIKKADIFDAYASFSGGAFDMRLNFASANIPPAMPKSLNDLGAVVGTTPGTFAEAINPVLPELMRQNKEGAGWITMMDYVGQFGAGNNEPVASAIAMNKHWERLSGGTGTLPIDHEIPQGKALFSPNGSWRAEFQADGNVVVYRNVDHFAMHASETYNQGATRAIFQSDGNFVIYSGDTPLASTGTNGLNADRLVMQDDGCLVIYAGENILWSSDMDTYVR